MRRIIVSDTSSLILLHKINRLELLHSLFGKIIITKLVAKEFGETLPDYIEIKSPKNSNYQKILERVLDKGEASVIALALENSDSLLIIDELKGRREAKALGINITGILGILIASKKKGIIDSVSEILNEIKETNFRISEQLIKEVKSKCGE